MLRFAFLILLGFFWSSRLAAIKAAGLAGIPPHVTITVSVLGIAILFTALAIARGSRPPLDRSAIRFYVLSGALGFILPFILENLVSPHLPVFVFMVIIATMPVITLTLAAATGLERPGRRQYVAIGLGFCVALLIAADTAQLSASDDVDAIWAVVAVGVPLLYAVNTLFVASRWPQGLDAIHVAHAQAVIIAASALAGSLVAGTVADWPLASRNAPAIVVIVLAEAAALLVYLKIIRRYGPTFVSLANYVAMVFAAILGAALFGDQITFLSIGAALVLVAALTVNPRSKRRSDRP